MKLHATMIPYSGTVGGGLRLIDEAGVLRFMVSIFGASKGITNEQTMAIAGALMKGLSEDGIEVPEPAVKIPTSFPY
jgi:hypothetical protein